MHALLRWRGQLAKAAPPVAQGECALDAENTVKLFTMDQAQPGKADEFTYEIALQVQCC